MSTQTMATVGPWTQTWLLVAAQARTTPWPLVAAGHPDLHDPSCNMALQLQQGHRLQSRPWASMQSLVATWTAAPGGPLFSLSVSGIVLLEGSSRRCWKVKRPLLLLQKYIFSVSYLSPFFSSFYNACQVLYRSYFITNNDMRSYCSPFQLQLLGRKFLWGFVCFFGWLLGGWVGEWVGGWLVVLVVGWLVIGVDGWLAVVGWLVGCCLVGWMCLNITSCSRGCLWSITVALTSVMSGYIYLTSLNVGPQLPRGLCELLVSQ